MRGKRRFWWIPCLALFWGSMGVFGQDAPATLDALVKKAEGTLPTLTLVMVDGRENEMFTRRKTYEPGMDIYDIRLAHLSGNTFLWMVNFGDVPMVEDSIFALYLDTDRNEETGFKTEAPSPRRGTDLEVLFDQGKAVAKSWKTDGADGGSQEIPWFKKGKSLGFAIGLPLEPVRDTVSFAMAAECHSQTTPEKPVPAMKDTTRKAVVHRFKINPPDGPELDRDEDGDGLSNRAERDFCTDPKTADVFVPIITASPHPEKRRAEASYVAGMDILEVAACHVAEDRYLFRATFAGPPSVATTTNILYLDVDNDRTTGRQMGEKSGITGCDIMLVFSAGNASLSLHGIDAGVCGDGKLRCAVNANNLYFCADLPIKATPKGAEFGVFMLTHTAGTPKPPMSDNTQRVDVTGFVRKAGAKRARSAGWQTVGGMSRAYGLDVIRPLLWAPTTVAVQYDKLELSGFDIDYYTTLEYGHIKPLRPEATAACPAPQGKYHVGFMIFDRRDYGAKVGIRVDGVENGSAAINAANNNYWLYWLDEAVDFNGGELVELVALTGTAAVPINYVLFLSEPPEPREQSCKVDSLAFRVVPDGSGDVQVSWISENPVPTRLEYGTGDLSRAYESPRYTLLHRAVLRGLDKGAEYQARAVGRDLEGKPVYSETVRFTPVRPLAPPTVAETGRIPLVLNNPHPTPVDRWLVRSGIPFPQGTLGPAQHLRLLANGQPVCADIHETAYWPDYSVKWVMVTFVADCPAQAKTNYELEYGASVQAPVWEGKNLAQMDPNTNDVAIDTGAARFRITPHGELLLADGKPVRTYARSSGGKTMATGALPATITVCDNGQVYSRIKCVVEFTDADGLPTLTVTSRYEFWSGSPFAKLSHSFLVQGKATHSEFEEITLDIPLGGQAWQAELKDGGNVELKASDNLYQREFKHYMLNGGEPVDGRFTGQFHSGTDVIVLRQFWELYPKGLRVAADSVKLDLCPDFAKGYYDSFPFDVNSTKYYFYLREGHYKFRRGMRKTHEILLGTVANAGAAQAAANAFQRPLLATAPAAWYCGSGAFYSVAPRNEALFGGYERNVDRNMAGWRQNREKRGDYGMLNFGDWFGERGVHWGNGEYDNAAAFLLEYIRSGNEEAYHLATEAEKHNRDVDIENWVPGKGPIGKVYIHQIGHNGGYYGGKSPKGADAWDRGGGSATHSWSEGHLWYYFLSGEEDARDAGLGTVDYHIATGHANYYHLAGELRNPAWRLIMDAAAYSATYDPAYLNAATLIMRTVYTYQDKIPRPMPDYQVEPGRTHQVGGWSRMMVPGHCHCEPRHRGNANFMVALLLSGIKYYHEMTGDPEAKEALIAGAYYLLDECYSEDVAGFRYTSCPKMRYRRGTIPYMVEGIARAYLWTGDKRFAHPLSKALPYGERGSSYGSGSYYRGGPRVLADMLALSLPWSEIPAAANGAANGPFKKPAWMTDAVTVVQAEDFKAQGKGECQVFNDREGAWGRIVSYWHADVGHWLEWEVEIPATGMYVVRFHYATLSGETRREFLVDGNVPCPEAKAIPFPPSGGFGMTPVDWVYVSLRSNDNKEVPIRLTKGKHSIRMVNLNDGLAFDFMAFVPAPPR